MRSTLPLAVAVLLCIIGTAQASDSVVRDRGAPGSQSEAGLCETAIAGAERSGGLPPHLLGAIGLVESGRVDPRLGRVAPWPWSINIAGTDRVFETKAQAIAAVKAALATGAQSIDVGCMQINLLYHPAAFASLDEAFDPTANTLYAARFLNQLFAQFGDWPNAAAAYHSQNPGVSEIYRQRVMGFWIFSAQYGYGPSSVVPARTGLLRRGSMESHATPDPDPHDVLTPEFRIRLVGDAVADRTQRLTMGLLPEHPLFPTRSQLNGPHDFKPRDVTHTIVRDRRHPAATPAETRVVSLESQQTDPHLNRLRPNLGG